jgi:hypothetical protein
VEKLSIVPITYLAAYCLNSYHVDELLTKTIKKAWKDLKWSLDAGNKWMGDEPDKNENPDEEDEETELDRDKDPTLDTTLRTDTMSWRSDRLADSEKKPVDVRKVLQSGTVPTKSGRSRRIQNSG